MESNGRGYWSRWDNAADVEQALRAAAQALTGGVVANSAAPSFQKHPARRLVAWESWSPFRELLVSSCGWFISTSVPPCAPDRKAQAALAIPPELDDPLGRRGKWLNPSRLF